MIAGAIIFFGGFVAGYLVAPKKTTISDIRSKVDSVLQGNKAKIIEKEDIIDQIEI